MSNLNDFAIACSALREACVNLIDEHAGDYRLKDARDLLRSALMLSVGIQPFLRDASIGKATTRMAIEVCNRVYAAFGAPGDWGNGIEIALRKIYAIAGQIDAEVSTS